MDLFDPVLVQLWEQLAITFGLLPTQEASWAAAGFTTLPGAPQVVEVREQGQLVALAPLVRRGSGLELTGARELGEPTDLLATSEDSLGELAEAMVGTGLPVELARIPADSATIAALRKAVRHRGTVRVFEGVGHPRIALGEPWAEPGGGLSSSRRSALRRSRRKAEQLGEIEIELLKPEPSQVQALLDEAFAVEARSWKQVEGTAVEANPLMRDFFYRYAAALAERGQLRVDFLRLDGRAVAMQLGACWRNSQWLFKIGYDASYSTASPGQILLAESIAAAARDGMDAYELLGSRAAWTDVWTKDVQACVRVVVLPWRPRSAILVSSIAARATAKRARRIANERAHDLADRARSRYSAGKELGAALAEERHYAERGFPTTVGYWNATSDSPATVAKEAIDSAAALPAGSEVAIKLAAMGGDGEQLDELLALCLERELTLHVDAVGADSAGAAQAAALRLARLHPGKVGCTLPGRWVRSPADAGRLREEPLRIRVVKGEFADQESAELDPSDGFLQVIELLAGHECHVEVATQDAALAKAALEGLLAKETSCELQVLHGMKSGGAVGVARQLGVPVRVYVPYGNSRLPYRRFELLRSPRLLASLARDLLPLGPRRPPGA